MLRKTISSVAVATMLIGSVGVASLSAASFPAAPTPKGTHLGYVQGNPYENAPLTALINLSGKQIKDVKVTVKGKPNGGIDISYPVGPEAILTHDGVPIVGMYQNYRNTVIVSYTNKDDGKKYTDTYKILTPAIEAQRIDNRNFTALNPVVIKKVTPRFKDALLMTNGGESANEGTTIGWTQGVGSGFEAKVSATGSVPFEASPMLYITDTQGEYRWWLNPKSVSDIFGRDIDKRGYFMGIRPTARGTFTFVFGQNWGEFDLTGKIIYKHRLPRGYIDLSHESVEMPNGNVLLRAAKQNYVRPDGVVVNTVRDHILEVDKTGNLIRVWDLNKSLDPLRDTLLKSLDIGAVCLNVDVNKVGQTADMEPDAPYGDNAGIGTGRNWAHVNSIAYDPKDDGIILSLRHQGTVKLTADNKVKWILAPRAGWNKDLVKKVLAPVDSKGKKLKCDENARCEGSNFDPSFTQHTSWISPNGTLTVYDNGDGRNNEQPALPTDKYSRFVEYDIDEDNMTVEQIWEYGKERGNEWYSAVTSNVELITDDGAPYMYGFGGSAGMFNFTKPTRGIHNIIDYKTKDVLLEIEVLANRAILPHYRGLLMEPKEWFNK